MSDHAQTNTLPSDAWAADNRSDQAFLCHEAGIPAGAVSRRFRTGFKISREVPKLETLEVREDDFPFSALIRLVRLNRQ